MANSTEQIQRKEKLFTKLIAMVAIIVVILTTLLAIGLLELI